MLLDTEYISIDKDCLDFLQDFLFKSTVNHYVACNRRAYLDFNRTLNFKEKKSQAERQELFDKGTEILRKSITNMMDAGISSQAEYDNWHFEVCTELRNLYTRAGIAFTFGQSQKWLNMMMKYLYVLGTYSYYNIFTVQGTAASHVFFRIVAKAVRMRRYWPDVVLQGPTRPNESPSASLSFAAFD